MCVCVCVCVGEGGLKVWTEWSVGGGGGEYLVGYARPRSVRE